MKNFVFLLTSLAGLFIFGCTYTSMTTSVYVEKPRSDLKIGITHKLEKL